MLKGQLTQLQDDNMKLQAEQNVKWQLDNKLGQLQENLAELKTFMLLNSQEAPGLQEEGDQSLSYQQEAPSSQSQTAVCLLRAAPWRSWQKIGSLKEAYTSTHSSPEGWAPLKSALLSMNPRWQC